MCLQAVEAAAEAAAAAREARMFEVAMNLAKTEAKAAQGEAEQTRREFEVLQSALKDREQALDALRIEVAGLKASFKHIDDTAMEKKVEHQQDNSRHQQQHNRQQHQPQQQQQHSDHQQQLRPVLGDAEHWLQGTSIALASLPSPSPRKPEVHVASAPVSSHQQQPASSRVFGAIINGNASRRNAASKQPLNHAQQQQYQFGAWPMQPPPQQQQQQQDYERNEHAVSWTAGGYSDGAAKKGRQQQSSSRGKLVFLR